MGHGADEVVDLGAGGRLPDDVEVVFGASCAPAALGGVRPATARGGTLVQVGNLLGAAASAALSVLVTRVIIWVGAYRFVEEIADALLALRDGLDVDPLIIHEFGVAAAAEAFTAAAHRTAARCC